MKKIALFLTLLAGIAAQAAVTLPSTPWSREFLRSTDASDAISKLGAIGWGGSYIAMIQRGNTNWGFTALTNAFAALRDNDTLVIRPGTHLLTNNVIGTCDSATYAPLRMEHLTNVAVYGYNAILSTTNYGVTLLIRGCSDVGIYGLTFKGRAADYMTLYTNSTTLLDYAPNGIGQAAALVQPSTTKSCYRVTFTDCVFENIADQAIAAWLAGDCVGGVVKNMKVEGCTFLNVGTTNGPAVNRMDGSCVSGTMQDGFEIINNYASNVVHFAETELTTDLETKRHAGVIMGNYVEYIRLNGVISSAYSTLTTPASAEFQGLLIANNVFKGFTATHKFGSGYTNEPRAGVFIVGAKHVGIQITGNRFEDFRQNQHESSRDLGIYMTANGATYLYATNTIIANNVFQSCEGGIYVIDGQAAGNGAVRSLIIQGNLFNECWDPIRIAGTEVQVLYNTVLNWGHSGEERWGLLVDGPNTADCPSSHSGVSTATNGFAANYNIVGNIFNGMGNDSTYPIFLAGAVTNMALANNTYLNYKASQSPVTADTRSDLVVQIRYSDIQAGSGMAAVHSTPGAIRDNVYIYPTNVPSLTITNPIVVGTITAPVTNSLRIGTGITDTNSTWPGSVAVGSGEVYGTNATLLGTGASAGEYAVAIGWNAGASTNCVFIGTGGSAEGVGAIAIGRNAYASGSGSIAIGRDAQVDYGTNSIAIGDSIHISGEGTDGDNKVVIGNSYQDVVLPGKSNYIGGKVVMTNLSLTGVSGTTTFQDPVHFVSNATMAANAYLSLSNLTASRALVSGATQTITNSHVTATELGYLSGAGANVAPWSQLTTNAYRTIWIDAGAMNTNATGGPSVGYYNPTNANNPPLDVWDFDDTTPETNYFKLMMPDSWDLGAVKVKFYYFTTDATASTSNVWAVAAGAFSPGDNIDLNSFSTSVNVTNAVQDATNKLNSCISPAITVGGTPALGDLVIFRIRRVADSGWDNSAGDARLTGVAVQWMDKRNNPAVW